MKLWRRVDLLKFDLGGGLVVFFIGILRDVLDLDDLEYKFDFFGYVLSTLVVEVLYRGGAQNPGKC